MLSSVCTEPSMSSDFRESTPPPFIYPQPGEIWELSPELLSPLPQTELRAYSPAAQRFLRGDAPARYVMIVRERSPEIAPEDAWQTLTVMVLSGETANLSDIDVLIQIGISALPHDVLAETWHVLPMLGCNLKGQVGNRLSRQLYDELMTIGDAHQDGRTAVPTTATLQAFHQREIAWSDVLRIPYAAYQTYVASLQWADVALARTFQVEQTLQQLNVTPFARPPVAPRRVRLSQWFQHQFEAEWVAIEALMSSGILHLSPAPVRSPDAIDTTSSPPDSELSDLLQQLATDAPELQRRRAIKQLGSLPPGNPVVIQALVEVLRSATDDETLWAAVESLWQMDPGNPAAGVRRVRLLDFGLQVAGRAVALAVAILHRPDQRLGVLLRVYPTANEPYVPEDLKLILLDAAGQAYEVAARRNDLYVQLKFNGHPGERFGVQVALGNAQITEEFAL